MRPKSFLPWRAPLVRDSWLVSTASGKNVSRAGMFQRIQCVHVPTGASGSSAIRAKERVCAGASPQLNAGETFSPLHVNLRGISPPLEKAVLLSAKDMGIFSISKSRDRGKAGGGAVLPILVSFSQSSVLVSGSLHD